MAERQQALAREILKDRDVASLSSFIGVDGVNMTPNSGRIQINLKPQEERAPTPRTIIRRLQPALARVDGHHALHAAGPGPHRGGSRQPHAVPVRDPGRRSARAHRVGGAAGRADAAAARAARRGHGPAEPGAAGLAGDRPRHRLAPRHHAAAHRRHALRRLRAAAGLDDLHPAEPVPRDPGGGAGVPGQPGRAQEDLREVADRRPGAAERVHALRAEHRAAGHQPPGQFPR